MLLLSNITTNYEKEVITFLSIPKMHLGICLLYSSIVYHPHQNVYEQKNVFNITQTKRSSCVIRAAISSQALPIQSWIQGSGYCTPL